MIWVAVSFIVGVAGAATVWFWWDSHTRKAATKAFVERELTKVFEQAKHDVEALPDPDKVDPKEVANALRKIRDLGRKPL